MRLRPFALLLAAVTGCAADREPVSAAASATWSVDTIQPRFDLGAIDTAGTVSDVQGAARLRDGTVVVADGPSARLHFYSAKGVLMKSVGGPGQGPMEFGRLVGLKRCGELLYAQDLEIDGYKIFDANSTLVRQMLLPKDNADVPAIVSACNADGQFVNMGWERPAKYPSISQVMRSPVPYWIASPTGEFKASIGTHAGFERWFMKGAGGGGGVTKLPLGKASFVALGKSRAYVGTADTFAISVYSLDGVPAGMISRSHKVVPVTTEDIERYKLLDTIGRPALVAASYVEDWKTMEFAKTLPAYTAMLVDSDDNLWVRQYPPATATASPWIVFSPEGKEIATAHLPLFMTVYEVGSDYVLGVEMNIETGVKQVKVLALNRR
jgi:hypothetical protein